VPQGGEQGREAFDPIAGDRLGLLKIAGMRQLIARLDHRHPAITIAHQ